MKYGKNIKLPKQFLYWCKKAGIKYRSYSWFRGKKRLITLQGHGCYWRINCHGHFQRSEPYKTFDRWGNSLEVTIKQIPETEKEFLLVVELMRLSVNNGIVYDIERGPGVDSFLETCHRLISNIELITKGDPL